MLRRIARCWVLIGTICIFAVGQSAWASPSGLNNIPTTDTVPQNVLVFQNWVNLAEGSQPEAFLAFKYGVPILDGLEVGVDWKALGNTHGHAALQAKHAFNIQEDIWKAVVGIANVSDSRKHNGEVFPYVATSYDLQMVKLHAGFAAQPHNQAFFAGIDRTFPFLSRNLQLKGDVIQIDDMDDALFSVGFLYDFSPLTDEPLRPGLMGVLDEISRNIVIEGWVSIPSTGGEEVLTMKLNYVIRF